MVPGRGCCISYSALVSDVSCLIYFEPTLLTLDLSLSETKMYDLSSDNKVSNWGQYLTQHGA